MRIGEVRAAATQVPFHVCFVVCYQWSQATLDPSALKLQPFLNHGQQVVFIELHRLLPRAA